MSLDYLIIRSENVSSEDVNEKKKIVALRSRFNCELFLVRVGTAQTMLLLQAEWRAPLRGSLNTMNLVSSSHKSPSVNWIPPAFLPLGTDSVQSAKLLIRMIVVSTCPCVLYNITRLLTEALVIVLPPMLTVHSWSSKASVMILSRNMLKRVGESRHPCRTPTVVRNQSPMLLLKRTALVALL